MKSFCLLVVGIAALSFSACEKQPYSKLELMKSPFQHDHAAEGQKQHVEGAGNENEGQSSQKATQ